MTQQREPDNAEKEHAHHLQASYRWSEPAVQALKATCSHGAVKAAVQPCTNLQLGKQDRDCLSWVRQAGSSLRLGIRSQLPEHMAPRVKPSWKLS